MPVRRCVLVLFVLLSAAIFTPAMAEVGLLWGNSTRQPLVQAPHEATAPRDAPSLFVGTQMGGLFAPYPKREPQQPVTLASSVMHVPVQTPAARIRDLIAGAEAGRAGYDAVIYAARIKPSKPPTAMTVGEIYDWIDATPNQHHAIGRYQFIPPTLRRLVAHVGATRDQRFSPAFQDQLADVLLGEAGLHAFHDRKIGRLAFMNNLAKIWAGLPTTSGRSHYHGIAGNRATMSWADFDAEMVAIYPG